MKEVHLFLSGIRVTGFSESYCPGTVKVSVEDNHEIQKNPLVYTFQNGILVKDTVFQEEEVKAAAKRKAQPSLIEEVKALKKQNSDLAYMLMLKGVL